MDLSAYLRIFRSRWILIAISAFLALGAAVTVTWTMPKIYEANAMIFVTAHSETSSSYENSQFSLQRVKSYPDLVYSPEVLKPALKELEQGLDLAEIRQKVSATNPEDTVYVKVTAEAGHPAAAAALANEVAQNLSAQIKAVESTGDETAISVDPRVAVPAVPPTAAVSPNVKVNVALGLLAGLAIGMIAAIVSSRFGTRLYTNDDVQQVSGLDIIGEVGRTVPRRTAKQSHSRYVYTSAYRDLWTNVLVRTDGQLPRITLVTSACPSAVGGTRTLRRMLARYLNDGGHRTCHLDTALASSDERTDRPGFYDLLTGHVSVTEIVSHVSDDSPTVIPSGRIDGELSTADAMRRSGTLLKEIAQNFDVTVAQSRDDAIPVDTGMVASVADSTLIVVKYGKTRGSELISAVLTLRSAGTAPLGVVMLDVPKRRRTSTLVPHIGRPRRVS